MPFNLPSINLGVVGWIFIVAAVIVLAYAILHFFGHLLHWIIRGCGVVVLAIIIFYVLHLLGVI